MAGPTSGKVGRGACLNPKCGEPVTYRRSKGGLLSWKCDGCDHSGFAQPGGDYFRDAIATIKGQAIPAPAPKAPALEPELPPHAIPAPPKRAASFFDQL